MRPYVLSVAGFDPSAGAGVLADCKTIEQLEGYALSAVTAITYQNENEARGIEWMSENEISHQLHPLLDCYEIGAVKIGIVESPTMLQSISATVREAGCTAPIIWDPVLQATAGLTFFSGDVSNIPFRELDLITPNREELVCLGGEESTEEALATLSKEAPLYVKSFSSCKETVVNVLATASGREEIRVKNLSGFKKHGSGCVLSAAIATEVAKGLALKDAVLAAEEYIKTFLQSTPGLLGYHYGLGGAL